MKRLVLVPLLLIGTQLGAQNQAASDPWAGTWHLNIAQSTFHAQPPKQETVTIAPTGSDTLAFKYTVTGTGANGSPINVAYAGRLDGAPYPHLVNGKENGRAAYTRVSSHASTCTYSNSDGSTGVETLTLSGDGRTFTVHQHVKAKQGEYDETHVFNKA